MNIDSIHNGVVLDHIQAGKSMDIYRYLHLDELDCQVAIIKNARSEHMEKKDIIKKSIQRTFQALRIDVNSEFEVLEAFLDKLPGALAPNGRVAVLTFHSGEDRMVKKAFKKGKKHGVFREISEEVIRPSAEECRQNGRARSTKMRWAVKNG